MADMGSFVAVVGPSGAGKDSLIRAAQARFAGEPRLVFARRVITRPVDLSSEDHDSLSDAAFLAAERAGAFCMSWQAHGLSYGIPAMAIGDVAAGRVVVANLSRLAVPQAEARFPHVVTLMVSARPEVLAARLAARGRESIDDVLARLQRPSARLAARELVEIDNSGDLDDAVDAFCAPLRALLENAGNPGGVERHESF